MIFTPLYRASRQQYTKVRRTPPRVFEFVHNYYRAATGLNVASVLCANRSTLFFDVCNICYGVLARDEEKKKKKEKREESAPVDGRSAEIFKRAAGAVSPSLQQRYVGKGKKGGELIEIKGEKKKE